MATDRKHRTRPKTVSRRAATVPATPVKVYPEQATRLKELFDRFFSEVIPRARRTMTEFAEQEIICPSGPFKGEAYRLDRQPFVRLLFQQIDSGLFKRFAITGPTQTGKTLAGVIIPAMYHLFEIGENVVVGIPTMDMAWDKWHQDWLPAIMASRYAALIPRHGVGSKGGKFESITFANGATLKFMSAKGDDAKRSGFTSRVLVMTEIDKYDTARESSREDNPVTQLIARLDAYEDANKLIYMECTVSVEEGRIWVEYTSGSMARIATPCPHCLEHVTLEREDLIGWQDAADELDARDKGSFACPLCGGLWSEEQRRAANQAARLLHKGQSVDQAGVIIGDLPRTWTCGFRWTAANNLLKPAADFASAEWRSQNRPDKDNNEKSLLQFMWARPWKNDSPDAINLTEQLIASRLSLLPRGVLPDDAETFTVHIDMHKLWLNWTAVATSGSGNERYWSIVDYGTQATGWIEGTQNHAAMMRGALVQIKQTLSSKEWKAADGTEWEIDLHLVDAGYEQDMGRAFVEQSGRDWMLVKGESDHTPRQRTADYIPGQYFHFAKQKGVRPWWLLFAEADYWMLKVLNGFLMSTFVDGKRQPGSVALFGDDASVHLQPAILGRANSSFCRQILGQAWDPDKRTFKACGPDHWLDNLYNAVMADAVARQVRRKPETVARPVQTIETEDGRPLLMNVLRNPNPS